MRISTILPEVTRLEVEALVAPLRRGDRPPHGLAGRADWHLCGFLSRLILARRVTGAAGETTLVATQGRLPAPRLVVIGVGPREVPLPLEGVAATLRHAAAVAGDLRLRSVAIEVPAAAGQSGLREVLAVLAEAFAPALPAGEGELQIVSSGEEELERWRVAIREAFPRGHIRPTGARLPRA